jgi:hypothetical protein
MLPPTPTSFGAILLVGMGIYILLAITAGEAISWWQRRHVRRLARLLAEARPQAGSQPAARRHPVVRQRMSGRTGAVSLAGPAAGDAPTVLIFSGQPQPQSDDAPTIVTGWNVPITTRPGWLQGLGADLLPTLPGLPPLPSLPGWPAPQVGHCPYCQGTQATPGDGQPWHPCIMHLRLYLAAYRRVPAGVVRDGLLLVPLADADINGVLSEN